MNEINNLEFKTLFKKRCFHFSIDIIHFIQKNNSPKYFEIYNQLLRSATSIGANIVEGGYSSSKKEFINYFQIALKSSAETLYWLAIFKEVNNDLTNLN